MNDRFYTSQAGHVVNVLAPVDITGGKTGVPFGLKKHSHASIILQIGVSAAAPGKVQVNACDDNTGANSVAIDFDVFKAETGDGNAGADVLSTRTPCVAANGFVPSAGDGIFYVIELDAAQLPQGKPFVQLSLTNAANSVIASAVAVLSGSRYGSEASDTVLS